MLSTNTSAVPSRNSATSTTAIETVSVTIVPTMTQHHGRADRSTVIDQDLAVQPVGEDAGPEAEQERRQPLRECCQRDQERVVRLRGHQQRAGGDGEAVAEVAHPGDASSQRNAEPRRAGATTSTRTSWPQQPTGAPACGHADIPTATRAGAVIGRRSDRLHLLELLRLEVEQGDSRGLGQAVVLVLQSERRALPGRARARGDGCSPTGGVRRSAGRCGRCRAAPWPCSESLPEYG